MQLGKLLEHITYESVQGSQGLEITDICYHSGKAKQGSLFICIKGQRVDGHEYLMEAILSGAAAVVIDAAGVVDTGKERFLYTEHRKIPLQEIVHTLGVAVILVEDTRGTMARLAEAFFDFPAGKLRLIGITGTKGKTTTAFLTAGILREAGYRVGLISTVWIDTGREMIPSSHTTPESCDLQRYLARMVKNGCDCCVMEVSSQGIAMQRVDGLQFDIGVFLNIEPDHIGKGEHASFSEYLHCKSRLLQRCDIGIVNRDDPHVNQVLQGHTCQVESFSARRPGETMYPADIRSESETYSMVQGKLLSGFIVRYRAERLTVQIQLPGRFNVYNALAAISVSRHFRVSREQIQRALKALTIPGRCENVSPSENYVLLIDYAHNEMSLKNLLETLRDFSPRRLVVLFGCGGNRSGLRRGRMGEAAGRLADFTILTSDNPRWEDPERILDDIEKGILETGGAYIRITDRRLAVRYAIEGARDGDIIVLAGKGHEDYQEISGEKYHMTEQELVDDAYAFLEALGKER